MIDLACLKGASPAFLFGLQWVMWPHSKRGMRTLGDELPIGGMGAVCGNVLKGGFCVFCERLPSSVLLSFSTWRPVPDIFVTTSPFFFLWIYQLYNISNS